MKNTTLNRIRRDLEADSVVLYLKGTAAFPMCGFSAAAVQVLTKLGIPFRAINVLEDPEIRDAVKAYSNWPTIPQLFIDGKFVGGSDEIRDKVNKAIPNRPELRAIHCDGRIAVKIYTG